MGDGGCEEPVAEIAEVDVVEGEDLEVGGWWC